MEIISPVVQSGVTYVPIQYFTQVLETNFVSGVSSPWVVSYEIEEMEGNNFEITNHVKTSASIEPDEITTVKPEQNGEY